MAKPGARRRLFLMGAAALGVAAFLARGLGIAPARAEAARRPNVIVILADDLGNNDVSLNGNPYARTPNIDSLARDGARLANGYTADAVCAPSRAGLLTGRYPQRFGFEYLPNVPSFVHAVDGTYAPEPHPAMILPRVQPVAPERNGLPDSEITLAQQLKTRGYATAAFGKWHLGVAPSLSPTRRGFDEFVGYPGGAMFHAQPDDPSVVSYKLPWDGIDKWLWSYLKPTILRNGKPEAIQGWLGDTLTDAACDFMQRSRSKPFFMYMAYPEAHTPLQAPRAIYDRMSYIKDEKTRVYYAMIAAMDNSVGRVLSRLHQLKLDNDTIVIFTSDNGGAFYTRIPMENYPYRGWKTTFFRGGVSVPYFIRWTGHIKPGEVVAGVTSSLDIFPTASAAAGAPLAADRPYDGRNLLPILLGQAADTLDDRSLYWRNEDYFLFRQGRYTLQVSKYPQMTWLFDLAEDPTERINLAPFMPDKVKEMRAALDLVNGQMKPPAWAPAARNRIDIDGFAAARGDAGEHVYWTN